MATYTNFNRHDNFSKIELRFMANIINFFSIGYCGFDELSNKLYGLYDGFYYDNLMVLCKNFIKENEAELKEEGNYVQAHRMKEDLQLIIEKIESLPVISETEAVAKL